MKDLVGRAAFITGAASGIGLGIARACHAMGMNVALADIDLNRVEEAAHALDACGRTAIPLALDIRDRAQWRRAADAAEATFGEVSLLCNNAGIAPSYKPVEDLEQSSWDLMLQVNLTGAFIGIQTFVPRMKARGQGGHIVNVSSMSGLCPWPGLADYCAAKFAVVGLSEAIRAELAPADIGVSVLCPGVVKTRLWRSSRLVRGLPDIDTPPASSLGGSASPTGRDPDWVGRRVLRAVLDNELYILTHPDRLDDVRQRSDCLATAFETTTAYIMHDPIE